MSEADNLLKTLNDNDTADYKSRKEDYDPVDVLSYFYDGITKHKLRFSDGTEGYLSFDN